MAAPVNNTALGVAAGASAIGSIAGYMSSTRNTKSMLASMTRGIESNKNSYLTRLNSTYEQEDALTRQMGDAMSARGLENLKAQSRLRVASASSGLSGNSIDEIVNQTNYDELFDTQILRSRVTESKTSLMYQRVTDKLNFMTQGGDIASQLDNAPDMLSSILSGLQSGIGTYTNYQMLNQFSKPTAPVVNNNVNVNGVAQTNSQSSVTPYGMTMADRTMPNGMTNINQGFNAQNILDDSYNSYSTPSTGSVGKSMPFYKSIELDSIYQPEIRSILDTTSFKVR